MKLRLLVASLATALSVALGPVSPAAFAEPPVYTGTLSSNAVSGYDAVAYFTQNAPVKGDKAHAYTYKGAAWLFSTKANLDAFKANPEAYAPQYGGYCAWAMADGKYAPGRPDQWKVVDGKLYLNYNASVQKKWLVDVPGFIARANSSWATLQK